MSFFWYDYETFGSNARVDRPAQFAGVRTDDELEVIDDPVVLYCRPAPDYLPRPSACLIHGMTPSELLERGLTEADFARRIHQELSEPDTCAVGYNAIRFDHEVTRFLLYRNLHDPYAWHWRNGNSRWDVIDLLRAAFALRPAGLEWPRREDGAPSFRLEDVAAANGLRHDSPHEAFADVKTTLDLARLVRGRQPDLFDYYLGLRDKREASRRMNGPFVWVSSLISGARGCATLMAPVAEHPTDPNAVIAFDLRHDPAAVADRPAEALREALFSSTDDRPPLYAIKTNACPFVAPAELLDRTVRDRLGLDGRVLKDHYRALKAAAGFGERVQTAYERTFDDDDLDVDRALYAAFIPDGDREMLTHMLDADVSLAEASTVTFEDDRISELIFRYRARSYPETLSEDETQRWRAHCRARHLNALETGPSKMDAYDAAIEELRSRHGEAGDVLALLDELADYGRRLRKWLG